MTWNRVYVVVWRLAGVDLRFRLLHLTRRGAERRMARKQRRDPDGDYRVERIRII